MVWLTEGGDDARHGGRRQEVAAAYDPLVRGALHARLEPTRRRFDRALRRVEAFLDAHPDTYVAWSGGKDSTVVAHLATRVDPAVTVGHYESDWCFPETHGHMADVAQRFGWRRVDWQVGSALEALKGNGSWDFTAPDGPDLWAETTLLGPARLAMADHTGMMWGLRAKESDHRAKLLARHRGTFQRRTGSCAGQWVTSPIWDWSTLDVWAYHAVHGIPPNPVYRRLAELGVPERNHRVSLVISSDGLTQGRGVWLRRGWPELWTRIVQALPRLREDG